MLYRIAHEATWRVATFNPIGRGRLRSVSFSEAPNAAPETTYREYRKMSRDLQECFDSTGPGRRLVGKTH